MKNIIKISFIFVVSLAFLQSCQQPGKNSTGSEYVPDMAHSVAIESNVYDYYYNNRWGTKDDYHSLVGPRLPVSGTVPRTEGSLLEKTNTGMNSHTGRAIPANGSVPYHYANSEEGRAAAMVEILNNPYPITASGLAEGKELYNIFCATCHGEKADGAGYLVREDGGKYPVQPANFMSEEHIAATNGRYYHAIYFGRNLMGSYKDKLSYSERWHVIQYIRSLQAAGQKLAYSETENTFNTTDQPFAMVKAKMAAPDAMEAHSAVTGAEGEHKMEDKAMEAGHAPAEHHK